MTYRYFAYGASLDSRHVAEWCQEHGVPIPTLVEGLPAVLDDHALVLSVPSRTWLGAVGTIEPSPGSTSFGMLFEVDDDQADIVRRLEGVTSGLFTEAEIEVRLLVSSEPDSTIQLVEASAFRAAEGRSSATPPLPSQRWIETVARGALERGLPETWVADIRRKGRRPAQPV